MHNKVILTMILLNASAIIMGAEESGVREKTLEKGVTHKIN